VDAARIRAAVAAGCTELGENRVQEAEAKAAEVSGARWHLVGPLQANKARRALELFDVIETVDSLALAVRLDRIARELHGLPAIGDVGPERRVRVLIQANVDDDPAKAGFEPDDLTRDLPAIERLGALELAGLMTVGRLVETAEAARPTFAALRALSERLRARPGSRLGPGLSMGMSHDYAVAVEEGATLVAGRDGHLRCPPASWRGRGRGRVIARIRVRLTRAPVPTGSTASSMASSVRVSRPRLWTVRPTRPSAGSCRGRSGCRGRRSASSRRHGTGEDRRARRSGEEDLRARWPGLA